MLGAVDFADYLQLPERLEGTWTIPVCDGSSLIDINVDYDGKSKKGNPPCMCGFKGEGTADFVEAANLKPKDMATLCFNYWFRDGLRNWPAGVDQIAYGRSDQTTVTKDAVERCLKNSRGGNIPEPSVCQLLGV